MPDLHIPALSQTRVLKLARVRRERLLPTRGNVLVQSGSRVGSLDIVAKTGSVGRLRTVPLGRYLHAAEKDLQKYLLKNPGDAIQAREIIASKPEFFGNLQRIYRAPMAGRISALYGAWLTMDLTSEPFELRALYRGSVVNVIPRSGVVVEATGALAQGVWGAGGECYGVLKKVVDEPNGILTKDHIDLSARGVILVGGAGITEEAIRRAAEEHVAGLIVGGLDPDLRGLAKALALPMLVTEGFGDHPMSVPIFELLAAHNGDEAIVNTTGDRRGTARSEVFIPILPTSGGNGVQPPPTLVAQVGCSVRVIGGSQMGEAGKIVEIPTAPRMLESGSLTWGAEVELNGGSRIFVPWDNLELIG